MNNLSHVFAKIASETPSLYPQTFVALQKDVFKVASLYAPIARHLSHEDMQKMHAKALGDNFSVLAESPELISTVNSKNLISSIVRANIISVPYEEKKVRASMKVLSANVFMDDENHIWRVAGKGDTARLVQSKNEDFGAILNERINSQRNVIMASCTSDDISAHDAENGDFVLYYSPASAKLATGLAFTFRDGFQIFSHELKEFEEVSTHNIVRAAVIDRKMPASPFKAMATLEDDITKTNGEFTKPLRNKYQDYMKFLYEGTDYFKKLTELLTLRQQSGNEHLPVFTSR